MTRYSGDPYPLTESPSSDQNGEVSLEVALVSVSNEGDRSRVSFTEIYVDVIYGVNYAHGNTSKRSGRPLLAWLCVCPTWLGFGGVMKGRDALTTSSLE